MHCSPTEICLPGDSRISRRRKADAATDPHLHLLDGLPSPLSIVACS